MSNCLIFALGKWFKEGGYLVIRKSRHGYWPHFIWCRNLKDADIEHFVPLQSRLNVELVHKFLFKGEIRTRDSSDPKETQE